MSLSTDLVGQHAHLSPCAAARETRLMEAREAGRARAVGAFA